jgi:CRP/FNR family transcriptional regulator, cyclic AMP receptor protein
MGQSATIDLFRNATEFIVVAPGEVIFQKGEPGDQMYAVVEGEVDIATPGDHHFTIGPGGIFGEMALIDASPRSATARAKSACKVVPVNQKQFMYMVQNTPFFAIQVLRVMAERMRGMLMASKS